MTQAILIAGLAGLASALLSGMLTPGVVLFALLVFVAPLPLFLAGFAWHPLVAALAGLVGAILLDLVTSDRAAIGYATFMALPSFVICAAAQSRFASETRVIAKDGIATGQIALSAVIYVALAIVASAIWIEPDYAVFHQRLREVVSTGLNLMGAPGTPVIRDPAALNRFVEIMTAVMLPASGLVIITMLVLSASIGAVVAERSGRITYAKPSFNAFRLPGGSLVLFGVALMISFWNSYTGLFAEIVALGLGLLLMLQGLAVLHVRLRGSQSRSFALSAAWASIIFFGLPSLLFVGVGAADHLFDLRKAKSADR